MFNLNSKSTFSATLLGPILILILGLNFGHIFLGSIIACNGRSPFILNLLHLRSNEF